MSLHKISCLGFCLVSIAALAGCGSGHSTVEGTVTLDGEPLPDAEVTFKPKGGGRPAMATTDQDGKFTLQYSQSEEGAPAGEYTVTITTATTKEGPDGEDIDVPEKLPPKYNVDSELNVTVEGGKNEFPFDLESGPMERKPRPRDRDTC